MIRRSANELGYYGYYPLATALERAARDPRGTDQETLTAALHADEAVRRASSLVQAAFTADPAVGVRPWGGPLAPDLTAWISWARRSRLESFKTLAATLKTHFDAVVRGMLDNRSNAFVEAMNGLMQQAKRAARGFRTAANFINIAYLRLSKLTHLPTSPFAPAAPR